MGRFNLKPARVHQTVTKILESKQDILQRPPWYTTMSAIPPSDILSRPQPVNHGRIPSKRQTKRPSKMYKPQPISYEEDHLRTQFYGDHPWELARPRVILEQDGKDGQNCDWSQMQQPGRPLNAESVVQRQLWLLRNVPSITSQQAYNQVREEFYALRHAEDIERRIAKEEALSTGAYFGKSVLEVGMELEDKTYEKWKDSAIKQIDILEQRSTSTFSSVESDDMLDEDDSTDVSSRSSDVA